MPGRIKCCGYYFQNVCIAASILAMISLILLIVFCVYFILSLIIIFGILLAVCLIVMLLSILRYHGLLREWDHLFGVSFIRQYAAEFWTGPTDLIIEPRPGEQRRNRTRRLWESALDLCRLCRRQNEQPDNTIDYVTRGLPENVTFAPEYDAASVYTLTVSSQDEELVDESRPRSPIRRLLDSEHTRPLSAAFPLLMPPIRAAWEEMHESTSTPDPHSNITVTRSQTSKMEATTEELNRSLMSNENEPPGAEGIRASQTPLPGPSGIQRRSGGESNETCLGPNETEAEIHTHFRPVSSELGHEDFKLTTEQRHSPMIQRERSPATQQQVMTENLPGQVEETEESAAVSPRIHRRTSSLDEPFQTEQNDQISEESSSSDCASILYSD